MIEEDSSVVPLDESEGQFNNQSPVTTPPPSRPNKKKNNAPDPEIPEFPLNFEQKVITNIFSNFNVIELSRVARVCKIWKEVSEKDELWKKFLPRSLSKASLPDSIIWKRLYLNRRKEFILTCKKNYGIFIRLDDDTFNPTEGGYLSGEVVINLEKEDKLLGPIAIRFVGYEEAFEYHTISTDLTQEIEIGSYSKKNNFKRDVFPLFLNSGIHTFPFSLTLPKYDSENKLLPPSVHYIWKDNFIDYETFATEYLVLAKVSFASQTQASSSSNSTPLSMLIPAMRKRSIPVIFTPHWDPVQKFSKIRFVSSENVYTSRFPFANVKLRASLQSHPVVTEEAIEFEISLEIENFNTGISGPITVTLFHTAESDEFVPPELHAQRTKKEIPFVLGKSAEGHPPIKKNIVVSMLQREFWIDKIKGPGKAYARCVFSLLVEMKVSLFTTISASLPIEFLQNDESKTEKEQDVKRPVVQLE